MSKKAVIITIIVILIVAIAVFIGYFILNQNKSPIYVSYGERALAENNLSICLELAGKSNTYPIDCWRFVASKTDNINLCKIISSQGEKYNCYSGFIDIRWQFNQQVLCDKLLGEDKNYCYMVTAVSTKDKSFCDKITNSQFATAVDDCKRNVV